LLQSYARAEIFFKKDWKLKEEIDNLAKEVSHVRNY
jgi:hypothetical protein